MTWLDVPFTFHLNASNGDAIANDIELVVGVEYAFDDEWEIKALYWQRRTSPLTLSRLPVYALVEYPADDPVIAIIRDRLTHSDDFADAVIEIAENNECRRVA